jgi:hypothetical protein
MKRKWSTFQHELAVRDCELQPGIAIGFFVRLVCACFSAEIRKRIRKQPRVHSIWGGVSLLILLLYVATTMPSCQNCKGDDARRQATRYSLVVIRKSISEFVSNEHRMPNSLIELTVSTSNKPALMNAANLNDSWGHTFEYRQTGGTNFEIRSTGPDGRFDTEDDLTN